MSRSFGLVDYKILEAEYFFRMMKRTGGDLDFSAVQYCASAFASAARSVTFAMQSSLSGVSGFDAWYAPRRETLRANPLAKFFHDFRTVTQHIGINVVGGGTYSSSDGSHYHFVACEDLPTVPDKDVISACEEYFMLILTLVYECYVDLGTIVDGQQYFTHENFSASGRSTKTRKKNLGFLADGRT